MGKYDKSGGGSGWGEDREKELVGALGTYLSRCQRINVYGLKTQSSHHVTNSSVPKSTVFGAPKIMYLIYKYSRFKLSDQHSRLHFLWLPTILLFFAVFNNLLLAVFQFVAQL